MITKQCRVCLHFKENSPILTCDAFPKGIPTIILKGEFDHTNEFEGDNGIRFERDFGNQQQNNNYSDKIKENSVYLDNVTSFIKLNYKCPKGTVDDSNKCNPEEQEKSNTSDSKSASETFIGFKADHDFSSPQDIETNKRIQASLDKAAEPLKKFSKNDRHVVTTPTTEVAGI